MGKYEAKPRDGFLPILPRAMPGAEQEAAAAPQYREFLSIFPTSSFTVGLVPPKASAVSIDHLKRLDGYLDFQASFR